MLERMNSLERTVLELLLGILVFGILFELPGIWWAKEKAAYSVGILCGVLIAGVLTIHMARSLDAALDWDAEHAKRSVRSSAILRYFGVAAALALFAWFQVGNLLACFLGIMTLKAAAYTQPLMHKLLNRIFKIEEGGCADAIIDDDDDEEFDLSEWAERRFHDPRSD